MGQRYLHPIRTLIILGLLFLSLGAQAAPLPHGITSGEVSATSAIIWARTGGETAFTVAYTTDARFVTIRGTRTATVSAATDFAGTVTLTALQPATRYYYRV